MYLNSIAGATPITAFNKNGLLVEFMCERDNSQATVCVLNVKASNSSPTPMTDFVFQAAVPKVKLELLNNSIVMPYCP